MLGSQTSARREDALVRPPHPRGELTLQAAVALHHVAAPHVQEATALDRLTECLLRGDVSGTESVLATRWRLAGLAAAHASLAAALDEVCHGADHSAASDQHRAVSTAASALELLRVGSPAAPTRSPIVLATPAGDRHTLALRALAHQLQDAGRGSLVVDDLPLENLRALASSGHVPAVVVSAHLPVTPAAVRRTVAEVRSVSPTTVVVFGGPGVPLGVRGPDLVTDGPAELIDLLSSTCSVLTSREREVLSAVADGLTNNEIAASLGVSPTTVKTHLDHVYAKTGTVHRAAAVAHALRKGWIS